TGVERRAGRWSILDDRGGVTESDIVAISTSHPPPSAPGRLASRLAAHPRFVADTGHCGAAMTHCTVFQQRLQQGGEIIAE
ncbi:hypothetical protein ACCT04_36475, partial [Rhizobium ruizarguesonis]